MNKKYIENLINSLIREVVDLTAMLQTISSEQREEQLIRVISDRKEKIEKLQLLLEKE